MPSKEYDESLWFDKWYQKGEAEFNDTFSVQVNKNDIFVRYLKYFGGIDSQKLHRMQPIYIISLNNHKTALNLNFLMWNSRLFVWFKWTVSICFNYKLLSMGLCASSS